MGETILKMQGIQKYFAGVHALDGVNFELKAGEVHALMGENGAGKSTLIKVLCGIHQRDGGSVEYFGEEVHFANIAESQDVGISVIHQELNIFSVCLPIKSAKTKEVKNASFFYEKIIF